jgi:hypothetical protein
MVRLNNSNNNIKILIGKIEQRHTSKTKIAK